MINFSDYFYYAEDSPSSLRNKVNRFGGKTLDTIVAHKNDVAGCKGTDGYYVLSCCNKMFKAHIIVWNLHNGRIPPKMYIDHIDRNKANNNISNLRIVTHPLNVRNRGKQSNNKSGIKGVRLSYCTGRNGNITYFWQANWYSSCGKQRTRNFAVLRYGYLNALKMAMYARKDAIEQLVENGEWYSVEDEWFADGSDEFHLSAVLDKLKIDY